MAQVAAVVDGERQDGVAGVEDGVVGGHVGLGSGVGLDVNVVGAE